MVDEEKIKSIGNLLTCISSNSLWLGIEKSYVCINRSNPRHKDICAFAVLRGPQLPTKRFFKANSYFGYFYINRSSIDLRHHLCDANTYNAIKMTPQSSKNDAATLGTAAQYESGDPPIENNAHSDISLHFRPGLKTAPVTFFGDHGEALAEIHAEIDQQLQDLFNSLHILTSTFGLYAGGPTEKGPHFYLIVLEPEERPKWKIIHQPAKKILRNCYSDLTPPPLRYSLDSTVLDSDPSKLYTTEIPLHPSRNDKTSTCAPYKTITLTHKVPLTFPPIEENANAAIPLHWEPRACDSSGNIRFLPTWIKPPDASLCKIPPLITHDIQKLAESMAGTLSGIDGVLWSARPEFDIVHYFLIEFQSCDVDKWDLVDEWVREILGRWFGSIGREVPPLRYSTVTAGCDSEEDEDDDFGWGPFD